MFYKQKTRIHFLFLYFCGKFLLYMNLSKEQIDEICRLTNTATEVYEFIMRLPSPLGEFVFKRIVENAYEIASVLDPENAKKQLIEAICTHKDDSKESSLIYKYLGVSEDYINGVIIKGKNHLEDLKKYLLYHCTFNNLPAQDLLIRAYTDFSPNAVDDEGLKNLEASVRTKIIDVIQNTNDTGTLPDNCFQALGYKTLYLNWISEDHPDFSKQFIDWYGEGKILNYVIDAVYKCNVYHISDSLWQHIQTECKTHQYLNNAFQVCYDSYRIFSNLPKKDFTYEGKEDNTTKDLFPALPKILKDPDKEYKDSNFATDYMLIGLYDDLKIRKKIECCEEDFKAIFSGTEKCVAPIKWTASQQELADFLYIARGNNKKDKKYAEKASKLFIQKNNKQSSSCTLNQEDTTQKTYKEFRELFKKHDFKR